ncbi:Selenocysteine-specific elongation factor [Actinomadura rubteroloni]|uniref:Selenocysteine-specific elongation factor n=1 Tax=Actinomadura rubteroloni TaxID=1926885 RepID=A0A2P4UB47_9ACTN|nr:SelB C-terminal domain-containing protein [Actinomadura rubteroloni]POM22269.1 Selenocysteine-specific elongation factor [Actinomadura rubteroloni]
MQVVVTAGHAGHGKSALVRALTGRDPVPLAPGDASGLAAAWTDLPSGTRLAFVDTPGGPRSVPAMAVAAGSATAALIAVAADEGWREQTGAHVAALDALGVRHAVLAVTRADVADPRPALRQARDRLAATGLRGAEAVAVSTAGGTGPDDLVAALDRLAARLPVPDPAAPVRFWIDGACRSGAVPGVPATVLVTGTLGAGTVAAGDELLLLPAGARVRVRAVRSGGAPSPSAHGVARISLVLPDSVRAAPGMALVTPGAWTHTTAVDVRTRSGEASGRLPRRMVLHTGSTTVRVRLHPLGPDTARLTLNARLPLHAGDAALLRDPERGVLAGAHVLDVRPPPLLGRGAAAARARELASWPDRPDGVAVLRRRGVLRRAELAALGCPVPAGAVEPCPDWVADPAAWTDLRARLAAAAVRHAADRPDAPGLPVETARLRLGLPSRDLVAALARAPGEPGLRVAGGRVHGPPPPLPPGVAAAVARLAGDLRPAPFGAPPAERLAELGLTGGALDAAERAGAVLRLAGDVVLLPGADRAALRVLSDLPQPFTPADVGAALTTSRRVAVALLEHLDRMGLTHRVPPKTD